eukprot:TRINITY_DN5880_c0_g1_i2.p1 TRINITY_DN5880_c0_g1~~TRINITY_DN5880_c0_g1_i2.p1  ORF type:complete len:242 (+),score=28.02 TRINITY_DN5880_c0_g1_i2:322-1047(+)
MYDKANIAMTYVSLCLLLSLGDDFSRINRQSIIAGLRELQLPDGSFMPHHGGAENDMRFVFCAFAVSYLLDDWSAIDVPKAIEFIFKALRYDYGFAQDKGQESHAGATYCALASLSLAGKLDLLDWRREKIIKWCLERQVSGFQGRCNKDPDTCYSFWAGASLQLLGAEHLIDGDLSRQFTMGCQKKKIGGFSKSAELPPDVLHTFYSLCGLSILGDESLLAIEPSLGITARTASMIPKKH